MSSSNKSEWIEKLTADYKKDLNEKNIQPLSDDYIKFIRFGQHFIDKNGEGILAYISNNSFIDGIIHRQMRKHLLESFDKIYILDLHGNAKKKEVAPDGSVDENVFDIMQGVSINIFIKTKRKSSLGDIYLTDCSGKREIKYSFLKENTLQSLNWIKVDFETDDYMFRIFSKDVMKEYNNFLKITDLLSFKTSGIKTHDDENLVAQNERDLKNNVENINSSFDKLKVNKYSYRPFENCCIYYDTKLLGRAREKTIYHLKRKNIGLILVAQSQAANLNYFDCVFITSALTDTNFFRRGGPSVFPLYLYPLKSEQTTIDLKTERTPNLNKDIVKEFSKLLDSKFTNEKETTKKTFAPIDILDYIYAILHNPTYREKYKEFLKIDFPRVPYPKDAETFWKLVKLGGELRQMHLLESETVDKFITKYPVDGNNTVGKIKYENGKVWINETQYFSGVPQAAWEFYIGGYQPAQKWLKDRTERQLSFEDIQHYQKIVVALAETERVMEEIDGIEFE